MSSAPDRTPQRRRQVEQLGPWFHNLHLPQGVETAPGHPLGDFPAWKWAQVQGHIPRDLTGCRALDIGCNAGFYGFELARRGAAVIGIDVDEHYLRQARWAARELGLEQKISFRKQSVYDLRREGERYELVLFMGVLYHLRHPLLALDILSEVVSDRLVFQSLTAPEEEVADAPQDIPLDDRRVLCAPGWPRMSFIERCLAGDPTNWWAPNRACALAMLRSAGFEVLREPAQEIFICRPDPSWNADKACWAKAELNAIFSPTSPPSSLTAARDGSPAAETRHRIRP